MKDPFKKRDVILKLSFRDLVILQKVLRSTLPDVQAEGCIIYLDKQVSDKVDEMLSLADD